MDTKNVAIVVGASGVTGTPMAEQLLLAGWKVYGVSRHAPRLRGDLSARIIHLPVDLTDSGATRSALGDCKDITHVFHCASNASSELRLAMVDNVLTTVEAVAPGFANFNLLQGMKYYGSYLGSIKTPAKESDPRVPGGDFFYAEEDLVSRRQSGRRWTWTAARPHHVCGYAPGNPMNLATALAVYGSMLRELSLPFGFPASPACFNSLLQVIDAELLARSAIWVSTREGCGNQAFNVGNGDIFRWKNMWPALAGYFGLQPAGPQAYSLAEFFKDKQPLWDTMRLKYGLAIFPYERAARWVQGDFVAPNSRLACEHDVISDTLKIRRSGFTEVIESDRMFLQMFDRFRAEKLIP